MILPHLPLWSYVQAFYNICGTPSWDIAAGNSPHRQMFPAPYSWQSTLLPLLCVVSPCEVLCLVELAVPTPILPHWSLGWVFPRMDPLRRLTWLPPSSMWQFYTLVVLFLHAVVSIFAYLIEWPVFQCHPMSQWPPPGLVPGACSAP
jgi:hypothetical protein